MKMGTKAAIAAGGILATAAGIVLGVRRIDPHPVRTMSGPAVVYTLGGGVRVLRAGGVFQSATYLDDRRFEPVFEYHRAFDAMFANETPLARAFGHGVREILMLGGGAFSYPKHLLSSRRGISLDVVEIDPSMIRAARRWFFVDDLERRLADPDDLRGNRMRVFEADARAFIDATGETFPLSPSEDTRSRVGDVVDALPSERYDAIVNDCFHGREPLRSLATVEAARSLRRRLVPGGLYLCNVVSGSEGADVSFLRDVVATLREVFRHVHVLECTDESFGGEDNYLVVATDSEVAFASEIPYDGDFPGSVLSD
ncbi:MAG: fused MFS/spermidine synthase [Collinsella sp.]|nr:fused MFS/spermidine synthase [Collinsella sp.]